MPDSMPKPPKAPSTAPRAPRSSGPSNKVIADGLKNLTQLGATGFGLMGDPITADVWTQVGPRWAEDVAELAKTNAALRRALTALVEGSQWGAVVGTSLCMVAPILGMHASALPDQMRATLTFLPQALGQADLSQYMPRVPTPSPEETPPPATAPGAR